MPVNKISAPYFAIQILALEKPPQNPSFFKNVEKAREFKCSDGFVRYTVGSYASAEAARDGVSEVKSKGYSQCFVVDISDYNLKGDKSVKDKDTIDPDKTYTAQIAAYRYPVYTDEFEEFDHVMEFYHDDRVYRYTVGKFDGNEALDELKKVQEKGYPNAHLVPLDEYSPFRIE
ncbi:MAG: SPOR domain-containing protein [Marinilabilia sp.]